jgi:hypothetical protein
LVMPQPEHGLERLWPVWFVMVYDGGSTEKYIVVDPLEGLLTSKNALINEKRENIREDQHPSMV